MLFRSDTGDEYQKGLKSANITDEKNEGKDKLALSNLSLGLGFIF